MYKHILIATDGSELAGKAVAAGFDLARSLGAKVTAVTVTEPWTAIVTGEAAFGFPVEEYEKSANKTATPHPGGREHTGPQGRYQLRHRSRQRPVPVRRNPGYGEKERL